ncbi:NAD(P)/FAD-dependent oxidoreductase [Radicibacter daui]|uniref:NAD(P)/FAD-dependent oxidoreductase n=1 Tax=Radicibacter daui TaxID=3064829 RepID=UPI004046D255
MFSLPPREKNIAVIGSGISGLAAAWLLAKGHRVTLFEAERRPGGHSNTVMAGATPVDTGFIVYNEATYPNLAALFRVLGVATRPTEMSFAVSMDGGRLEYAGGTLAGLVAQPSNLLRPRFWSMLGDLLRFYREAPRDLPGLGEMTLEEYLRAGRYGTAFRDDHLYPMAAAIWSTPAAEIGAYPAAAFIRFCDNHGLLKIARRPQWRTVCGGSRDYVSRMIAGIGAGVRLGQHITAVRRYPGHVELRDADGGDHFFDDVVLATHADQALQLLGPDASPAEQELLGAFRYIRNEAVLHGDRALMPQRRAAWSSWNYLSEGRGAERRLAVTYWMNRLQGLDDRNDLFVTLNPTSQPRDETVHWRGTYHHPAFDTAALAAQKQLWSLQGERRSWFCGAYFGAGFHEDGLQAGLAVAEALGGVRRPWRVENQSGRITLPGLPPPDMAASEAA